MASRSEEKHNRGRRDGGGPVPCGGWAGELTAWQSVGTGEQSRAGSLGEHYHLLQDTPRNIRGSVLPIGYLGWYSGLSQVHQVPGQPLRPRSRSKSTCYKTESALSERGRVLAGRGGGGRRVITEHLVRCSNDHQNGDHVRVTRHQGRGAAGRVRVEQGRRACHLSGGLRTAVQRAGIKLPMGEFNGWL